MTQIETNKRIAEQWFSYFNSGHLDEAFDLVDKDVYWCSPGSTEIAGTMTREQVKAYGEQVAEASEDGEFQIIPSSFVAEGERVAVQAESKLQLKNGKLYNQHYHFLFVIRDGKIHEVYEYVDTLHGYQTLQGVLF